MMCSQDTILRLNDTRPNHKLVREKYDKTNQQHYFSVNNKIQTSEDDLHEKLENVLFRESLRPLNNVINNDERNEYDS